LNKEDISTEVETPIATKEPDVESMIQSPVQQSRKRSLFSLFNHHQVSKSSKTGANHQTNPPVTTSSVSESSSKTAPYFYIDHEKTTTLKEIANERLQQQARRMET